MPGLFSKSTAETIVDDVIKIIKIKIKERSKALEIKSVDIEYQKELKTHLLALITKNVDLIRYEQTGKLLKEAVIIALSDSLLIFFPERETTADKHLLVGRVKPSAELLDFYLSYAFEKVKKVFEKEAEILESIKADMEVNETPKNKF